MSSGSFLPFQSVSADELKAIVRRRQRSGIAVDFVGGAGQQPKNDVSILLALLLPCALRDASITTRQVRDVKDTLGICISGGGLRSASFGMGALQALSASGATPSPLSHWCSACCVKLQYDWYALDTGIINQVDYLSCVSGGTGACASLYSHAFLCDTHEANDHRSPPLQMLQASQSSALKNGSKLRDTAAEFPAHLRDNSDTDVGGRCRIGHVVELAMQQLRRHCAHSAAGSDLLHMQLVIMIFILLTVLPLMAAAGGKLAAASITDAIGDTLHSLLTQGFHPLQLAAVLVFFGPIWTGLCCFMSALATHEHDMAVSMSSVAVSMSNGPSRLPAWTGLRKVAAVSVAGQVAMMCASLMAALFCVLLLMLLEEQLLTQTMMDEVLLLVIWMGWAVISIRALVKSDCHLPAREKNMLSSLQVAVFVCGLWLASRACVRHVMRREGGMAYSSACLWLLVMVASHDVLMATV